MDFTEFSQLTYRKLKSICVSELSKYYEEKEAKAIFHFWILERNEWSLKDWILNQESVIRNAENLWADYQKLIEKMPVQYVLERAYFMGLPFFVNSSVLIPRPETENLIYAIQKKLDFMSSGTFIDVCSGSGCIAIGLKKLFPKANIIGIEISKDAIEVAQKNADAHNASIQWINQSILDFQVDDFQDIELIVSNPPYVPESEREELPEHVKNFEPEIALFTGNNPLLFYEKITDLARFWLKKNGILAFEVHPLYAQNVKSLLEQNHFKNTEILTDDFGKLRMVFGIKR